MKNLISIEIKEERMKLEDDEKNKKGGSQKENRNTIVNINEEQQNQSKLLVVVDNTLKKVSETNDIYDKLQFVKKIGCAE
jgi:hypothetical protein